MRTTKQENRPYMLLKRASKELDVGFDLLRGMMQGGHVEGFESLSPKGNRVFCIYKDEVERLRAMIEVKRDA